MALSFNFNPFTGNFDQISTVTISGTPNGLSIDANQVLSLALASTSTTGALSSTDWNTFNSAASAVTSATSANTPNTIVKRDASGNFAASDLTIAQADTVASGTLAIGTVNASIINIGRSGATVNIQGTTIFENSTTLNVSNPVINVNTAGGVGSGSSSGINIEENSIVTGYALTSGDRNSWQFKAPNTAGIATITPGTSGITLAGSITNGTNSGTNTGDVTLSTANGLSLSGQALSLALSSSSTTGALSSTDWSTFNSKQAAGNYITALTGDVTASGPGSAAATLATVNSNVGSYTNASITVNAKGLVTAASSGTAPVTSLTVNSSNGFAGTSSGGTTPALTLSTTVTGILYGNGTSMAAAVAGNFPTLNQNTTGTAANITATSNSTLTTLSALSLPYSQVTGGPSGTVTSFAFTNQDNVTGTVTNATSTPTLALAPTSSTPAASSFASWDANKNLNANNLIEGYTTTVTAAGTTTLVVGSTYQQYFTGTSTQTVVLPVTSTLVLGQQFQIINNSTGVVTVESSGANVIQAMAAGTQLTVTVISTSLTTAAAWNAVYVSGIAAVINPTQQTFTSGSGTYTTPSGVQYIRVRMVGSGGGGAGGGNSGGGTGGGNGNSSTFGSSLLTANGGSGGAFGGGQGGAPGLASISAPAHGTASTGGYGMPSTYTGTATFNQGGNGGASFFGGGGYGGYANSVGTAGLAYGSGGGGGATAQTNVPSGPGGGAGGYVEAIIPSPSSTYSYSVGAGVGGGSAGTNGFAGGASAGGYIEVTEYYTNYQVGTTTSVGANLVLAGPASGSNANPTFRSLVTADMPAIIAARYYGATTTIGTSFTTIKYPTVVYDTASAYNTSTGVYTAPVAGLYRVTCVLLGPNISVTAGSGAVASVFINGTQNSDLWNWYFDVNATQRYGGNGSVTILCNASDSITIQMLQPSSGAIDVTNSYRDYFSIEYLGAE
jgi:hypothetical protein